VYHLGALQSVPICENEVPTDRVVHFQVPTEREYRNDTAIAKPSLITKPLPNINYQLLLANNSKTLMYLPYVVTYYIQFYWERWS
jgi:hypothetical protein